jgi:hypothetical protein
MKTFMKFPRRGSYRDLIAKTQGAIEVMPHIFAERWFYFVHGTLRS